MKPILFNTEMVQAIWYGQKTVTRRLVKPRYKDDERGFLVHKNEVDPDKWGNWYVEKVDENYDGFEVIRYVNPPFVPGDILYVREAWSEWTGGYVYKAGTQPFAQDGESAVMTWKPSIHMPKEAARIFLRVMDVRVERLQDITMNGYKKEGIKTQKCVGVSVCGGGCEDCPADSGNVRNYFRKLWDSTIRKSDREYFGWETNPFVWVVEFERCEKPEEE